VLSVRRESQQHREVPTIEVHLDDERHDHEEEQHEQEHHQHEQQHAPEHDHHENGQHPTIQVHLVDDLHEDEEEQHEVHHEVVQHEMDLAHEPKTTEVHLDDEHLDHEPEHHEHHEHHESERHQHEPEYHEHHEHEPEHHEHHAHHEQEPEHHEHHGDEADDECGQEQQDYDDKKFDTAAVKIQAGFKGYKTRKEVKAMKVNISITIFTRNFILIKFIPTLLFKIVLYAIFFLIYNIYNKLTYYCFKLN